MFKLSALISLVKKRNVTQPAVRRATAEGSHHAAGDSQEFTSVLLFFSTDQACDEREPTLQSHAALSETKIRSVWPSIQNKFITNLRKVKKNFTNKTSI